MIQNFKFIILAKYQGNPKPLVMWISLLFFLKVSGKALVYGRNQLCQLFPFGACITVDHQLGINLVDILFHSAFREK